MNLKIYLRNIKFRFKAALKAFLNPTRNLHQKVFVKIVEPSVVLDNQLLAGQNVLITGGARNIGRGIAIEMAKQGANIYFTDINIEKIQSLEKELEQLKIGGYYQGFLSDITIIENTQEVIKKLKAQNIIINILVNNVGVSNRFLNLQKLDILAIKEIFEINLFGPLQLTHLIVQQMIENKVRGSIIFISSIHQDLTFRDLAYSSSKAAISMTIKELALELAPYEIRVNGIAPGWVKEDTEGNPYYHKIGVLHESSINPDYIGRAAVYLTSDYFSYFTTGTILKIDGGLSLLHPNYLPPKK